MKKPVLRVTSLVLVLLLTFQLLPLNTLANAVLAQSDRMNQMASQNYDNNRPETIVRTRGIQ